MNLIPSLICSAALMASAPASVPPAPAEADAHEHKHHFNDPSDLTPEQRESQVYAKRFTDQQLAQFAVYEREVLLGDPKKALAKSKLNRAQVERIEGFVRPYYLARQGALRQQRQLAQARERIAKARAAGTQPANADLDLERLMQRKSVEHEEWRTKWASAYGEKIRAMLDKREADFVGMLDEAQARAEKEEAEQKAAAAQAMSEEQVNRYLAFWHATPPATGPARAKALASAQIDEQTVRGISLLATEYYRHRLASDEDTAKLADARRRLAETRSAGKQTAMEERFVKYYEDQLAEYATFRQEFVKRYGEKVSTLFDKFLGEFSRVVVLMPPLPPGLAGNGASPAAAPPAPRPAATPAATPKP